MEQLQAELLHHYGFVVDIAVHLIIPEDDCEIKGILGGGYGVGSMAIF